MSRRPKWVPAVAAAAALALSLPVLAQVNTTVVMKSGERHSGQNLTFRIDRGNVSMGSNQWQIGQVAYIDFGGTPDVNLTLSGSEEAVVMRDGRIVKGQILELGTDPATHSFLVIVRDQGNQEQRFNANQVARVYFAGGTAAAPTTGTTAATASAGGGIVVSGNQQWTSTGMIVRRGEWLTFNTTGQVQLGTDASDIADAAGSKANRMSANAPLPNVLTGALIGRIGNGRPFGIGTQTRIQAPDAGQLFLGINDDHVGDNSGEFRVEITRERGRR